MKKIVRMLSLLLVIAMMLAMAACGANAPASQGAAAAKPAQTPAEVTVYALVPADWQDVRLWAWQEGGEDLYAAWPGEKMGNGEYCYASTVPSWVNRVIINANGGTIQTADLVVEPGRDVWVSVYSADDAVVSYEAPVFDENKEVTVYAFVPAEWNQVSLWAWQEGGEDLYAAWPGEEMGDGEYCYASKVPAWVNRVIINADGGTVQTADLVVEPGRDVWVYVFAEDDAIVSYDEPVFDENVVESTESTPFLEAARAEDFDTMKKLLPTIDRSILMEWDYNDFNYAYAADAIRAGDYETAIEFFGYCAYEDYRLYATVFRQLLDGDREAAMDTIVSIDYANLDIDLDMTWPEIICMVTNAGANTSELDRRLLNEYLERRLRANQPSFRADILEFGDFSAWQAQSNYVGQIQDTENYPPVSSLNTLYSQCGREANGKVLIIRSQKSYPQGTVHRAIDLSLMEYLSYDLYPASLSEVEYIIEVTYDYTNAGNYQQTFSMGENSVVDYFAFLRMKGQVDLKEAPSGKSIQKSQWIEGTGEVEAHFSDLNYQCSNMPETGADIISAVEKVRQLNAA